MNKKKIRILIIVILIAVFVCIAFNMRNSKIKSVSEYFWGETDENMNYLVKKYNQTAVIEDYTIILDSAIFDDKTETIYGRFIVSKRNSKAEANIYSDNSLGNGFGEDDRFSLWVNADIGGEGDLYGQYDGNNLIIYCKFRYLCEDIEDTHEIYLSDGKTEKITYENSAAKFMLEPTSNAKKICDGSTKVIYLSPVAIKITSKSAIYPNTIEICYKNGETEKILDVKEGMFTGNEGLSCASLEYTKVIGMPYLIDIEQVESIIYNGEKLDK